MYSLPLQAAAAFDSKPRGLASCRWFVAVKGGPIKSVNPIQPNWPSARPLVPQAVAAAAPPPSPQAPVYSGSYYPDSDPPSEEELGWRTDFRQQYLIGKLLGQGSFGQVYLGVDLHTGKEVAVKVLPKVRGKLSRDKTLEKLAREVDILERLQSCPGVIQLEDVFEDAQNVLIVTELCAGGDLQKFAEVSGRARLSSRIVFCLKDSTHNPLVSRHRGSRQQTGCSSWLKAIDFGCSQFLGSRRLSKRTGTPVYMAPELYSRDYYSEADMWSLGVMLYQLYARRFPFWDSMESCRASKLEEVAQAVTQAPISYSFGPWMTMSPNGRAFIQACLSRDPAARLSVQEALQHPWLQPLQAHMNQQQEAFSMSLTAPRLARLKESNDRNAALAGTQRDRCGAPAGLLQRRVQNTLVVLQFVVKYAFAALLAVIFRQSPSAAAAAAHAVGLPHKGKGIAEQREFVFDPATQVGMGIDPDGTQAVSAASRVWDKMTGQLKPYQFRPWKLTKGQVQHASGLNNSRRDTEPWLALIEPQLQHLAAASSAGTFLIANVMHITTTLATWDAVWEVYLDPKWARQWLRLYGAQDRALEQFFKKLEKDMAEVFMERHGRAMQLVVFFGAASIGTWGGWGADAVLRACCKVVCRPRGSDQLRGRVVLVDDHRTTRVSSAVNGKQPCEEELDHDQPTRRAGWKPPTGQVEHRLLRSAWSQQRDQPVRGLMWCPVEAPRKPPQAPCSSQEATQPAASEPGPSTPPPANRSKRTKAEQAAEPTQPTEGKGKESQASTTARQRIGESRWRPLQLCYWPDQGALPAKGKEYPGLGYKRLRDKPLEAQQQQQQPVVAQ
ncbi:hypothetical protein QJQ45_010070 [Haematococcus lacustris]|nr:hypothetical protein QJQ45_010070 [Haematococcus lacustris]